MELKTLESMPPWEWPGDASEFLKRCLRNRAASPDDRVTAAKLSGELTVMDDEIATLLLKIVEDSSEADTLRAKAVISLGPVLEEMESSEFDDEVGLDDDDEPVVAHDTFVRLKQRLRRVFQDQTVPKEVRRRILEASVRAQESWHTAAVETAWRDADPEWKVTAVFCMGYIPGFDPQILEALRSSNQDLRVEALRSAGSRGVPQAWPEIETLLTSRSTPKRILLAAIEAAPYIDPEEANPFLIELSDSRDLEIAEAAEEALSEIISSSPFDGEDDDDGKDAFAGGGYVN